jgi:cyanophycinase
MTAIPRRLLLTLLASAALPIEAGAQTTHTSKKSGHLVIIGGAEDRQQDRVILRKFLELSGGPSAKLRFITAASGVPDVVWASYQAVFKDLGALDCQVVPMLTREDASHPDVVSQIADADGIFITGGDQTRLMACLWESPAFQALHRAFFVNGACVGGTSAGAAVMSRHMLALGTPTPSPQKDTVSTDIGLGFVANAIVDQHFSQRHRLSRLLSALAQRPDLLGVGIDEDTALIIEPKAPSPWSILAVCAPTAKPSTTATNSKCWACNCTCSPQANAMCDPQAKTVNRPHRLVKRLSCSPSLGRCGGRRVSGSDSIKPPTK